jgi:hypothetical protein
MTIWDYFLESSIGNDEAVADLRAWMKAMILAGRDPGSNPAPEKMLLLYSPAPAGKTVLISLLQQLVPVAGMLRIKDLMNLREYGDMLRNLRLLAIPDICSLHPRGSNSGGFEKVAWFIKLSLGHECLFYRKRYGSMTCFKPNFAIAAVCNSIPEFILDPKGSSIGRRLILVRMRPVKQEAMDPELLAGLLSYSVHIKQWALDA